MREEHKRLLGKVDKILNMTKSIEKGNHHQFEKLQMGNEFIKVTPDPSTKQKTRRRNPTRNKSPGVIRTQRKGKKGAKNREY